MTPIEQLIDDANPIADPRHEFDDGDVRALLTLTLERNADMDMKEVTRPVGPEPRPTRWWVAAAAFISVVAVAGAALLIFNGDSGAPASPDEIDQSTVTTVAQTTTTQEAAPDALVMTETMEAFIVAFPEAFNRRDIDAYRAMFDPAAVRSDQRAPELGVGVDRLVEEANDLWNQRVGNRAI